MQIIENDSVKKTSNSAVYCVIKYTPYTERDTVDANVHNKKMLIENLQIELKQKENE